MIKDNETATALIGVGATITGTVLGWILNNLSNRGNLHFLYRIGKTASNIILCNQWFRV